MPLTVTHAFVSAKSDSPDATLVRPTNWNANHTITPYTESTWTPTFTFQTLGDLTIGYTTRVGVYTRVGRLVTASFTIVSSSFAFSTSSGALLITGLPLAAWGSGTDFTGGCQFGGWTKASYTMVVPAIATTQQAVRFVASGSGQSPAALQTTDIPSGGSINMTATITYEST